MASREGDVRDGWGRTVWEQGSLSVTVPVNVQDGDSVGLSWALALG